MDEIHHSLPPSKFHSLGMVLHLPRRDIDGIARNYPHDATAALYEVVKLWLEQRYNVRRHGPPTWRRLVEAVAHPGGGGNIQLARRIADNHNTK